MKKKLMAMVIGMTMLVASIGSAGAYWTADPGPDPNRCGYWERLAERGVSSGQYYFDLYNCVWVEED